MLRFRPLLILFAVLALSRTAHAQDDSAVPLPPFIVEEVTKGPPWRYGEIPGFEILSRCSDRTARDLAGTYYRLHQLLGLLVPESLQTSFALPRAMIFYDEALQSAASQEVVAEMLKNASKETDRVDPSMPVRISRGPLEFPTPRRFNFLANLRLWDVDAMSVFSIVRDGFEGDQLMLKRDYVNHLLLNRTPSLPAWYAAGVLGLYERTDYETGGLSLRPLVWISDAQTSAVRKDPKTARAPQPLAEFFSFVVPARTTPEGETSRELWRAQAALFVRWALDGKTPAQRTAFFDFVARASEEPVTEKSFREFFDFDFAAADAQLALYLPNAVRRKLTLEPDQPIKLPTLALRDATNTEIARIKGDWERLEVGFVKLRSPALASKYLEQARRTLMRAYDSGARDTQLLANLGLCECDAGNDARAREFLEDAALRGPIRPRANYELARLRFAETEAGLAGTDEKLSATQLARVLTPLFAARTRQPPLPQVYELIARTWLRSAIAPERKHLAVLDEGIRLFPRRVDLLYCTAALYAERRFPDDASAIIELGLRIASDDADRTRFTELKNKVAADSRLAPN